MSAADEVLARRAAALRERASEPAPVSPRPRLRLVVITCMDARIDVFRILGLRDGDAHILRNAGGLVTDDVLRSLVLSQRLLGTTEVMIMQHTDCGLHGLWDADLLGRLTAEAQQEPPFSIGGFQDLEESVRAGIEQVRSAPWLPTRYSVRGFFYDVNTADLREVKR